MDEQRIEHYHHSEPPGVRIKLEKNSRGYGWEIAATAPTVSEALMLLEEADAQLRSLYGPTDA